MHQFLRRTAASFALFAAFSAHAADLTVSAAASLTNAFREVAAQFEAQHAGTKVLLNFAASDALLAQISKGAPVDVFASADQETMDRAASQKLLVPDTRQNFAANALVVVTPSDSKLSLASLADLQHAGVARVAIGNPGGVPAGRYAKSVLEAAQLWPAIEAKAVMAQNVRQALDYVARGEADAAFVYATDAASQKDKVKVAFSVPTPTPITYPVAAIADGPNPAAARQFIAYLASPAGQAALARYGFRQP